MFILHWSKQRPFPRILNIYEGQKAISKGSQKDVLFFEKDI